MHRFLFLLFFLPTCVQGQGKYLLYLKDKPAAVETEVLSDRSIARRKAQKIPFLNTDFPVSTTYLQDLQGKGWQILGKSKWLNAVLVTGNDSLLAPTLNLPYISGMEGKTDIRGDTNLGQYARLKAPLTSPVEPITYGSTRTQIQMLDADTMHLRGYLGKGVLMAVMDAGYISLNTGEAFKHLDVVHTYNYVHSTPNVDRDDTHGTEVLSLIAGFVPGKLSGTAPDVQVALYTTEDIITVNESKLEEVYWIFAAEHADSLGVDIINTSLGYSRFTDASQHYTYEQMNGKTTMISKAANHAASVGILVVIAAGNEGDTGWKYISAPADAEKVIAVGAVNAKEQISAFSSYGPSADGRIKPEVSAQGEGTVYSTAGNLIRSGRGTSYAAPLISGLLAGLRQQFPTLTALQLREILLKSADRYTAPDMRYGYGIPSYTRAAHLALSEYLLLDKNEENNTVLVFPNPNAGRFALQVNGKALSPDAVIDVWTSAGDKVGRGQIQSSQWEELSEGVYFVRPEKMEYYFKMLIKK